MENRGTELENFVPSIQYVVDRYCLPSWHLEGRILEYDNFMLVTDGRLYISFDPEEEYITVEGGYLIYCPRGGYRKAYTDALNPMHCYAVNFDYSLCLEEGQDWSVYRNSKSLPIPSMMPIRNLEILAALFKELNEEWTGKKRNYQLKCRIIMMEILYYLLKETQFAGDNNSKAKKVERAMNFISKHYSQTLTLEEMADVVSLSPVYFGSIFKEISGYTPKEYHHYIRISKARDLLLSGGYTVGEVAELVGYGSIYYFSRMFKRITGSNPSEYKNISRNI